MTDPNYFIRISYWVSPIDAVVHGLPRPPIIIMGGNLEMAKIKKRGLNPNKEKCRILNY